MARPPQPSHIYSKEIPCYVCVYIYIYFLIILYKNIQPVVYSSLVYTYVYRDTQPSQFVDLCVLAVTWTWSLTVSWNEGCLYGALYINHRQQQNQVYILLLLLLVHFHFSQCQSALFTCQVVLCRCQDVNSWLCRRTIMLNLICTECVITSVTFCVHIQSNFTIYIIWELQMNALLCQEGTVGLFWLMILLRMKDYQVGRIWIQGDSSHL
jgi:hypothetical protein